MPEPSSATQISLVSYLFLSIYIYVYVLSYILRFTANVPFIVSYFFIWCFGYAHSRIPYMAWVGFRTAFTDGVRGIVYMYIEEMIYGCFVNIGFCVIVSSFIQGISKY